MKRFVALALLPLLTGCLTGSTPPKVALWNLACDCETAPAKGEAKYGIVRVLQVVVRSPYDVRSLTVHRADGTLAFDPYNEFAALPPHLLKGVVADTLNASGRFKTVVPATSPVRSDLAAEVEFTSLTLDATQEGVLRAKAAVAVRLADRADLFAQATGEGVVDVADGQFSVAFSKAVTKALAQAIGSL